MPALSFMKQFAAPVERGDKTHSVRAKRKRPWKVGDKLALYTAMRTKFCRLLFRTVVTKVQDITIRNHTTRRFEDTEYSPGRRCFGPWITVVIDEVELSDDEMESFARSDGFADLFAFARFWEKNHEIHKQPFHGDVIHWKYPGEAQ